MQCHYALINRYPAHCFLWNPVCSETVVDIYTSHPWVTVLHLPGICLNITWTRFPPRRPVCSTGPALVMRSHAVRRSDNLQPDTGMRWGVVKHWSIVTTFVTRDKCDVAGDCFCHFVAGEWRHTRWPPQVSGHNVVLSSRNAADKSWEGWQLHIQRRRRWAGPRKAAMFKEMN